MGRFEATGRCGTSKLLYALLRHLGVGKPLALLLVARCRLCLPFRFVFSSGMEISFTPDRRVGWEFHIGADDEQLGRQIHERLTESTRTHTFHLSCSFSGRPIRRW